MVNQEYRSAEEYSIQRKGNGGGEGPPGLAVDDELPGGRDPETVLQDGQMGNFEQIPVLLPPENPNAEGSFFNLTSVFANSFYSIVWLFLKRIFKNAKILIRRGWASNCYGSELARGAKGKLRVRLQHHGERSGLAEPINSGCSNV